MSFKRGSARPFIVNAPTMFAVFTVTEILPLLGSVASISFSYLNLKTMLEPSMRHAVRSSCTFMNGIICFAALGSVRKSRFIVYSFLSNGERGLFSRIGKG